MLNQFNLSFSRDEVFRGNTDTVNPDGGGHYGSTNGSHIHFDPGPLELAASGDALGLQALANSVLHEAAHVMRYQHPNGESLGVYTDYPFNLLPPLSGPCIK